MTSTDVTTLAPCNVWIEWRPYADDCTERRAPYALLVRGVVYGWWERRHLAERARAALLDAAPVDPAPAAVIDAAAQSAGRELTTREACALFAEPEPDREADIRELQALADAGAWEAFDAACDDYRARWTTDRELVREIFLRARDGRVIIKTAILGRFTRAA